MGSGWEVQKKDKTGLIHISGSYRVGSSCHVFSIRGKVKWEGQVKALSGMTVHYISQGQLSIKQIKLSLTYPKKKKKL